MDSNRIDDGHNVEYDKCDKVKDKDRVSHWNVRITRMQVRKTDRQMKQKIKEPSWKE